MSSLSDYIRNGDKKEKGESGSSEIGRKKLYRGKRSTEVIAIGHGKRDREIEREERLIKLHSQDTCDI